MLITVIIPVYNAEETILESLQSISDQSIGVNFFEVIVINDGSTDKSIPLVEEFSAKNPQLSIQIIQQENGGVSKARNAGLKLAKGDYIALLDADDVWLPTKIEKQIEVFNQLGKSIDFLATARNNNKILYPYIVKDNLAKITFNHLLIRNEAQPSTVVFRKELVDKYGYFDDNQKYVEDVNYWLKLSQGAQMYILAESLLFAGGGKRSFGVSGLSSDLKSMKKGYRKNIDELLASKRLNYFQYFLLRILYELKYYLLIFRSRF